MSGLCFHKTHNTFNQRRFTRAIGPQKRKNRTRRYIKWDIMKKYFFLPSVSSDGFGEMGYSEYVIHDIDGELMTKNLILLYRQYFVYQKGHGGVSWGLVVCILVRKHH